MTIIYILTLVFCISIIIFLYLSKKKIDAETQEINDEIKRTNKQIQEENAKLQEKYNQLKLNNENCFKEVEQFRNTISTLEIEKKHLNSDISDKENQLNSLQNQLSTVQETIKNTLDNQKDLSNKAFTSWWENLERNYEDKQEEYQELIDNLNIAYSNQQMKLIAETDECRKELDKIRSTRAAAIQAVQKEKEFEKNYDDYRLNLKGKEIADIKLLKSIQDEISNPLVIDKIIWSSYYQPLAKVKFPKIIGKSEAYGIYKITNIKTKEIYIGQSRNGICERWKQHCKNALGIGTTTTLNKLYKSMREYGLYNFTFEVLEECENSQMDEKEKYYIEFYDTYNFGLNSTRGNN